jgi:carbon-monoxide dehydrogenase medium subunit
MSNGEMRPAVVIDIRHLAPKLSGVTHSGATLVIGALTTHRALVRDATVRAVCPLLAEAASLIGGGVQVHNKGTIGGNICHAQPNGDYLAPLVALDAQARLLSVTGERTLAVTELLASGPRPAELLTEIHVPIRDAAANSAYYKLTYSDGCYTIASAACMLERNADGTCQSVRLALGGVEPRPLHLTELEAWLTGRTIDTATLTQVVNLARAALTTPLHDVLADANYRRTMAGVVVKRAIVQAMQ